MVNRNISVPLYHQIKQALLDQIQSGHFDGGRPLPSEKELQERFGVSSITVRRALGDLEQAGYVTRQPGRGTFAFPSKIRQRGGKIGGFPDDLRSQGFKVRCEILNYCPVPPPKEVARRLGVSIKKPILQSEQLIFANDKPVAFGYVYHNYTDHITFTSEDISKQSVVNLLRQKGGLTLPHAERITSLSHVCKREAELLALQPDDLVVQVQLAVFDVNETCLVYTRSLYRGDRYTYHESIRI